MSILIAVLIALATTLPEPSPARVAWVARGEFCEPETVLPLPDDTLLVSNVCGFQTPGNGFLTLLAPDGHVIDWRIVDKLDAPLGMALQNGRLFVIDSNRVKIFSWPQYRHLETIALETKVANDIAVAGNGSIYVTDTAGHKVIEIEDDGTQSLLTGKSQFEGANGIHIHGHTLYVGGSSLWKVDLKDNLVTKIGPEWLTDIDGIELEADGILQVTPVAGPLVRLCEDGFQILGGDGISSANHGYAAGPGLALIPTGFDNTVVAISLDGDDSTEAADVQSKRACQASGQERNPAD